MMFVVSISWGQVSINAGSTPYSENFDALTTTNFNLTNNTSITGVYAFRTLVNATPNVFTAETPELNLHFQTLKRQDRFYKFPAKNTVVR